MFFPGSKLAHLIYFSYVRHYLLCMNSIMYFREWKPGGIFQTRVYGFDGLGLCQSGGRPVVTVE